MKLTKQKLKEIIREELLNERTSFFDEETSQVSKLANEIDGFIANGKYKNLLKHDVPEVKKWVKQLIPLLKKSQNLFLIYRKLLTICSRLCMRQVVLDWLLHKSINQSVFLL